MKTDIESGLTEEVTDYLSDRLDVIESK